MGSLCMGIVMAGMGGPVVGHPEEGGPDDVFRTDGFGEVVGGGGEGEDGEGVE